jgi:hypothetical protein
MGYSHLNMRVFNSKQRFQSPWVRVLGIVCIALVLLTGVIQVSHAHAISQAADHEGCSLCITAHHAVQGVSLVTLDISVRPVTRLVPRVKSETPRQRFLLKLANRPPPAVPAFA